MVIGSVVAILAPACAASAEPTPAEQLQQAHNELEHVIEAYNAATENLKKTQADATELDKRITALDTQVGQARGSAQAVTAEAYRRSSNLNTLSAVLSAGSSGQLVDRAATLKYVNRSQQRVVSGYVASKRKLDEEKSRHTALVAEQAKQQSDCAGRRTTIEARIKELEAQQRRIGTSGSSGSSGSSSGSSVQVPPNASPNAAAAITFAKNQIGLPYQYGSAGPSSYDCSGLTMAAWKAAGVSIPRTSQAQYSGLPHVSSTSSLQPGDLVFYNGFGHVAIFIGNGTIIHAPQSGETVKTASLTMMSINGMARPG